MNWLKFLAICFLIAAAVCFVGRAFSGWLADVQSNVAGHVQ